MVVPIISAFFGGFGLTGSFNGLNTYNAGTFCPSVLRLRCVGGVWGELVLTKAEAIPAKRSEVIAGKYIVQYIFAAASTAAVQPLLDAIGAGWTFTICMPPLPFLSIYVYLLVANKSGVVLSLIGGLLVWTITKWGLDMQQWAETKFELGKKPGF